MTGRRALRFWLLWTVRSAVGAGVGFVLGYVVGAVITATAASVAGSVLRDPTGMALVRIVAAGLEGAAAGLWIGVLQAGLLPWCSEEQARWIVRGAAGWGSGLMLGVALVVVTGAASTTSTEYSKSVAKFVAIVAAIGVSTGGLAGLAMVWLLGDRIRLHSDAS